MAPPIYLLEDQAIVGLEALQSALSNYTLQSCPNREDLLEKLRSDTQAVVLFSTAPANIEPTVTELKNQLSAVSCVAVLEEGQLDALSALPLPNAEFIVSPNKSPHSQFEIRTRMASAIRLSELTHHLYYSAQHDEVTLLYNRRYFVSRLREEISLARRHLSPLAVVVFGIDFFHGYMDSYGYDFTIQLIKFVASQIEPHVRTEDIIARIADDEVGLLLPEAPRKGAVTLVRRILKSCEKTKFEFNGASEDLVLYAGISGFPTEEDSPVDPDSLIRYARHALHNAKCNLEPEEFPVQLFSDIRPLI